MPKLRYFLHTIAAIAVSALAIPAVAQQTLPDAPSATLVAETSIHPTLNLDPRAALESTSVNEAFDGDRTAQQSAQAIQQTDKKPKPNVPLDKDGNPIPLERRQPQRILGFMPNFRSVSVGAKPHPPGWKYNFTVATHQATDYSSFIFLALTSLTAEGLTEHPALGKGVDGFYAYTWRGFLDKTDGTYLSAWLLPSLLHEDTRFYPLGSGHSIPIRVLYIISRQGVARTYGGRQTPNIAGLGGKVLTQVISRTYYPPGATTFGALAEKFGYSAMRDVMFSSIREFYPDIAAHYVRKHRQKVARMAAKDTQAAPAAKP
ncbi:MAG TPA: hypothetical protein VIJ79_00855 [Acidobacteriaceae bacterium]